MNTYYTSERNVQVLIFLMKKHGIRKIVASPGTTNFTFIGSIQNDDYFTIYSSVDERSAAYLACGLSVESGEPVALSCTGATASRNYFSGLTEAYYRKIPILAITSTQHITKVGNNVAQVIDRSIQPNDTTILSVHIPSFHSSVDEIGYSVKINEALLELTHNGGGPVHINLATEYSKIFDTKIIPPVNVIKRFTKTDNLPPIKTSRIGIFVGNHKKWTEELTEQVDTFCEKFNAVVIGDPTSNYCGKYKIYPALICSQQQYKSSCNDVDLLIHIGDVSGASFLVSCKEVWRVNQDGIIRDTFGKLSSVFEFEEEAFFMYYNSISRSNNKNVSYYNEWKSEEKKLLAKINDLPFSNAWLAWKTCEMIPENSTVHLGILNSLRTWSFFPYKKNVLCFSNTGGFGIDGCLSTLIGASLYNRDHLYFGIIGDLSFFYDMNSLGNRHVGNNLRILIVNNGLGTEFKNFNHPVSQFGEEANAYMAAAGHFGRKSHELIKHYAIDLGFEYYSATNKQEYNKYLPKFVSRDITKKSVVFEVFTKDIDESEALRILYNLEISVGGTMKKQISALLGEQGTKVVKKIIKRD